MNFDPWWLLLLVLIVALAVAATYWTTRNRARVESLATFEPTPAPIRLQETPAEPFEGGTSSELIIGTSPSEPMLSLKPLSSLTSFGPAKPLEGPRSAAINRLVGLMEAAPSVLVAYQAAGRNLMEVVVRGDLARASDGVGFRAFVKDLLSGKIVEQARLFSATGLQHSINVAAVWQVANVLVAQKHLADISSKLTELENSVADISRFLDNQRKARIEGMFEYLNQVYKAIELGEFYEPGRNHIEACERDLIEIQEHLAAEFRERAAARIEIAELGTLRTHEGIAAKVHELELLAQDIAFCLRTRIVAWHVLSLFPGNPHLVAVRRESIREAIQELVELGPTAREAVQREIGEMASRWNRKKTLATRRSTLSERNDALFQKAEDLWQRASVQVRSTEVAMLEAGRPTHLLLHIANGVVVHMEERAV